MEHYFDAAKVFVLAESAKNETVESRTDDSGLMSQIPDSTWPLSNDDSYDHERLLQLTMLFLVLFFLVRKLSKSLNGRYLEMPQKSIKQNYYGNELFSIVLKYFHGS